jgi:glycosyltransferase involved in cell wall biosynthesis
VTTEPIRVSIGITAYNEEANIGRLLEALLDQELATVAISEIIVVASGCTDRTHEIVAAFAERDPRIRLLIQPRREGKTAAINLFLAEAKEEIVVVQSGDTLVRHDTIEHLIRPFADPTIGMTGAQKVPVNASDQFIGYMSHLRLQLEHQLCLEVPRLGELIAFRKLIEAIPTDVAMDEAFMEAFIIQRGLRVVYAPNAVVYNMGRRVHSPTAQEPRGPSPSQAQVWLQGGQSQFGSGRAPRRAGGLSAAADDRVHLLGRSARVVCADARLL